MTPEIRPATPSDLEQVYDVWVDAEIAASDHREGSPPSRDPPALHRHELENGQMVVAELDGRAVGFAALITRSPVRFLAELYVRSEHQSRGIGRKLLDEVMPREGLGTTCTLSSDDERALALYIRYGMQPHWPYFYLRVNAADLGDCPALELDVVEANPGDGNLLNWDRGISGRQRPQDHDYWLQGTGGIPLWFRREDHTVGYAYVQMRSDDSIWYPDAVTIGPIGARTIDDARLCTLASVTWARERGAVLRIGVPGLHPALAPLLDAGFRITDMDIFVCRGSGMFVDPRRYIPSGGALF